MLESGMFVNIHQSGIKNEPAVLMTPDKVFYFYLFILFVVHLSQLDSRQIMQRELTGWELS